MRWELAVQAWPRPANVPERLPGAGEYEDDPTLPWWDRPEEPAPRPHGRLLLAAVLLLLVLLLVAVVGAVVLG